MKINKIYTLIYISFIPVFVYLAVFIPKNLKASGHINKPSWLHSVRIPEPGRRSGLDAVRLIYPGNFWAVGAYQISTTDRTFAIHWNGRRWVYVFTPNPSAGWAHFFGVAGKGVNDVWAVGTYAPSDAGWPNLTFRTLAEHWNGLKWRVVPTPNKGKADTLFDIAVLGPNDAWAVGGYYNSKISFQNLQFEHTGHTLIEHWNGYGWKIVPSPDPDRSSSFVRPDGHFHQRITVNALSGIAAVNSHDIWAVGHYWNGEANRTLILQWNGHRWIRIRSPNASRYENVLYSAVAISPHNVWAAGTYRPFPRKHYLTLIEQWNGYIWRKVPSPNIPRQNNQLYSISAWGNNVWAVGRHDSTGGGPLAIHWNGRKWVIIPGQKVGNCGCLNTFNGVAVGPAAIWTAGEFMNMQVHKSFVETGRSLRVKH